MQSIHFIKNHFLSLGLLAFGFAAMGLISTAVLAQPVQAQTSSSQDKPNVEAGRLLGHFPSVLQSVMKSRGRLGVVVISISKDLQTYFGAPEGRGLLVEKVLDNSPAKKAGLKSGDVILEVMGQPIRVIEDIFSALQNKRKGDLVALAIIRNKKHKTLDLTLDSDDQMQMSWSHSSSNLISGMSFNFGKEFPFSDLEKNSPMVFAFPKMEKRMRELEKRLRQLEGKPAPRPKKKKAIKR